MENPLKTLSEKLESEIYKKKNSSASVEELLDEVLLSERMVLFFKNLEENPNLKKIIFLHRFDQFMMDDVSLIAYFHLCSMPKTSRNNKGKQEVSKTLSHIISEKIDTIDHRGEMLFKKFIDNEENSGDELKRILVYLLVHFIRNNPKILKLANGAQFDHKILCAELKDPANPILLKEYFADLTLNFDDPTKIDPIIKAKVEKLFINIVSKGMSQASESIENISNMLPNVMLQFHRHSVGLIKNLLNRTGLVYSEYSNALDDLYRYKLIISKSILFWCESCDTDTPRYDVVVGKFSPEKLTKKSSCRNCGKRESFSSIFSIDPQLFKMIYSKDGILPIYLGWLLEKHDIDYTSGHYTKNNFETDYIIKNSVLIECKMYKQNEENSSLQSKLNTALKQMSTQLQNLHSEGIIIKQACLVWNIWETPKEIIEAAKNNFPELFMNYAFSIIGPNEIEKYVTSLKASGNRLIA